MSFTPRIIAEVTSDINRRLDRLPIEDAKQGKEIAQALEIILQKYDKETAVFSEEMKERIKPYETTLQPVEDLLEDAETWAPGNEKEFKQIVMDRIKEKIKSLSGNILDIEKEIEESKKAKEEAIETQLKLKEVKPPEAGSESSTVPRTEAERQTAIIDIIQTIGNSPLGQLIANQELYNWAYAKNYSLEALNTMQDLLNRAPFIINMLEKLGMTNPRVIDILPNSQIECLYKIVAERNIPYALMSNESKLWGITHLTKFIKIAEVLSSQAITRLSPEQLTLLPLLIKRNALNENSNYDEIKNKIEEIHANDLKKINTEHKSIRSLEYDNEELELFIKYKGNEVLYLDLSYVQMKNLIQLIENCPNINHLILKSCKITPDSAKAIASSNILANLSQLDLRCNYIGDEGAKAIASSNTLTRLLQLDLRTTNIGNEGAIAIASSNTLASLSRLDLGVNKINEKGAIAIASSTTLASLSQLDLCNNQIGVEGAKAIASSNTLASLSQLDLRNNQVGVEGAKAIASSNTLTSLTQLDLSSNNIGDKGVKAIASSNTLTNLTQLNLSGNNIGDKGVKAIASSNTLTSLSQLDLHGNNVGIEGVKAIASSNSLTSLSRLDLGNNQIGDQGAIAIASSNTLTRLSRLYLSYNQIEDEGTKAIANSNTLTSISHLDLSENQIGIEGVKALASPNMLKSLSNLDLSGNLSIGDEGAIIIASSNTLANLSTLSLHNTGISDSLIDSLNQVFGDSLYI